MKKIFAFCAALAMLAACTSPVSTGVPAKVKPVKNIILMITDGTSTSLIATARWYKRYMQDSLDMPLAIDPYICGLVQSRLSDAIIPDSAPAMAGYTTGVPQKVANISIYPEPHPGQDVVPVDGSRTYQPAATILEAAKTMGKATGIVVTTVFPHATPAATAAHSASRHRYHDLGWQMASQDLDVMFGGGIGILNDAMREEIRSKGATLLENDVKGFREFSGGKVWSLWNDDIMDYEIDRDPQDEPSLSEMTSKALDLLSKDKDGFFLMVEGSKVDYGAHSQDPVEAITEFIEFDNAIKVAMDFARKDGNTAVVILPDHGNSGITLGDARYRNYAAKGLDSMFVGIKDCRISSWKMSRLLQQCPKEEIPATFKEWTGIDLKPQEIKVLNSVLGYTESDYMKVSHAYNLQGVICGIFTSRTHIGFTSGNHTGEDVFLACYNPHGQRPNGIITNTALNDYMCRMFGMPSRERLVELSDEHYIPHLKLFEGCEMEMVPDEDFPTLFVRKGDVTLRIPAWHSEVYRIAPDGSETMVPTIFPSVYMQENGQFYVDRALASQL